MTEEEEEERLYLQLETHERVQTNEAKSKRRPCQFSPMDHSQCPDGMGLGVPGPDPKVLVAWRVRERLM